MSGRETDMVEYIWIKDFDKICMTIILNVTTAVTTHNKVSTLSRKAQLHENYEASAQNTISGNTYNLLHLICEKLQWKPSF